MTHAALLDADDLSVDHEIAQDSSEAPAPHRQHVRSPVDVLRLIIAVALVVLGLGVANLFDSAFLGLSDDGSTALEGLPDWAIELPAVALAVTLLSSIAALAVWTFFTRRFRRLAIFALALALATVLSVAIGELIFKMIDGPVRDAFDTASPAFRFARADGTVHPGDPLLAGSVALLGVGTSYVRRSVARRLAVLIGLYAAISVVGTGVPAIATLTDVGVGLFAASLLLLIFGRHDLAPNRPEIVEALGSIGLQVVSINHLAVDARASAPWTATRDDGQQVFIKALGRDERSADLMFRAYRWLRLRKTGDHRPFVSLQRAVEHEALVSLQAAALGIRTPRVLGVASAGVDGMVLAYEGIEGQSADNYDDLGDDTLAEIWTMIQRLHENRIAHRDLRLANIFIDTENKPWLIDFGFSELAASDQLIGTDAAELLASTAALVGPLRAVAAAHHSTGHSELERTMRWLQPLALSSATRQAIGGAKGIAPVRKLLIEECGIEAEPPVKLQRVDGKTLFIFATLALSGWFLLPQLADVGNIWTQVRNGSPGWAAVAVGFSLLTYGAATGALLGAIPVRLRFAPALLAQLASSFANRVTPAKVGGVAINIRYFQRQGVPTAVAGTAVGLNAVAGLLMHIVLTFAFLMLSSAGGGVELPIPSPSTIGLALATLVVVIVVSLALPITRRMVVTHVVPQLQTGWRSLGAIAHSPARVTLLFGGSATITLAYLFAMVASLRAFGSDASIPLIGLLFLTGSAIASAAPTPGGLGAAEAALIAAFSTIEEANIVVPAVFLYRFVTFWLPIVPGWLALTFLRRTDRI